MIEYDFYDIYCAIRDIQRIACKEEDGNIEKACGVLKNKLNKFFEDSLRIEKVKYTENFDKHFFGLIVSPLISSDLANQVFAGYSPLDGEYEPYNHCHCEIEIDGKLLRDFNLTVQEIWAIMFGDIMRATSADTTTEIRNIIDAYIASKNIHIDIGAIFKAFDVFKLAYVLTLHNISSVFAKPTVGDCPTIVHDYGLSESYASAMDKFIRAGAKEADIDTSTIALDWFFNNYRHIEDNRYLESMFKSSVGTEASSFIRGLSLTALKYVCTVQEYDNNRFMEIVSEGKRRGLIYQMKRNGIKSIEEDLFEYNMRLRNVENQDEAILLMRQINSRMSILEDYIRTENIDDADRKRWEDCYAKYLEIRDALSKKTVYNRKMYGLFVDYNALQNMSQSGQLMNTYY